MTLHWLDIALVIAIVVAGSGVNYLLLVRRLQRTLAENQRDADRRIAALTEAVLSRASATAESATEALGTAEIEQETSALPAIAIANTNADTPATGTAPAAEEKGEIPPQIQAAIAAAAIATLGNHIRVRSARRVPSSDVVSPWTQQGRVIVQSSHNLRTQGSR